MYIVHFGVGFVLPLLVLPLLLVRLRFRLMGHLNLISANVGYYTVRLFGRAVHFAKFELVDGAVYATLSHLRRRRRLSVRAADRGTVSVVNFLDNAFFLIADIRTLDYFLKVGNSGDASMTAQSAGVALCAASSLAAVAKSRYPRLETVNHVDADFSADVIQGSFSSVFYMTPAEIIYGVLYAVRRTLRQNRELRRRGATKKRLVFRVT